MAFIDKTIETAADIRDVYAAWTTFEDHPRFMTTIEMVTFTPQDRLHWVALVEDESFEWDADSVEHVPEEKISWRAVDGRKTGEVRFEKLGDRRTQVTYQLEYEPSAWGSDPQGVQRWMDLRVAEDLDAFTKAVVAPGGQA